MRSRWIAALFSSILAASLLPAPCQGSIIGRVIWTGEMPDLEDDVTGTTLLVTGSVFTSGLLEREIARIDSISFSRGYAGCTVGVDTVSSPSGAEVIVEVDQGERTLNGEVKLSGDTTLGEEEIREKLGMPRGGHFDPVRLGRRAADLVRELGDSGHPFAQVWITGFRYDAEDNSADVSISIFEGDAAEVSRVVFEGITKTDSSTARRVSRLKSGAEFSESSLERAGRYLRASRLFEKVGEAQVIRRSGDRVDIAIPVEERARANSFSGAFGFSRNEEGEYRTNGAVELVLVNIGGKGRDVSFDWLNDGRKYSRSRLEARERFLFSTPLRARVELAQTVNDTLYDMVSAAAYFSIPIGPAWSVGLGVAGDRTVFSEGSDLERSSRQRYRVGVGRDSGGALTFGLDLEGARRRNESGGEDEVSENQLIYGLRIASVNGISGNQSLATRLEAHGVVSGGKVTLAEMFPLGGARSLRGYRENQFRGEQTGFLSVEYRFGGESRLFLFDDVGAFYREGDGWTVKNGFGFGLRSTSRAGTVELSFGLGDQVGLSETKIHISLIESF